MPVAILGCYPRLSPATPAATPRPTPPPGISFLIFDVRTMKMVWSYNGQGMLGMKGESVLYQCH